MKEFILLLRRPEHQENNNDPEKMNTLAKKWSDWLGGITSDEKQSGISGRLTEEGKVLKPCGVITDGPFVEIKEKLGGFVIVKAENLDAATTLAHGCPILDENGSVEIRPLY